MKANQRGNERRKAEWMQRRAEALTLRRLGLPYREIGRNLGVTTSRAHAIVQEELKKLADQTAADAMVIRELELQRLDRLTYLVWKELEESKKTDTDKVRTLLRIGERRAALLGLDAPTRIEDLTPSSDKRMVQIVIRDPERLTAIRDAAENPERFQTRIPGANGDGSGGNGRK